MIKLTKNGIVSGGLLTTFALLKLAAHCRREPFDFDADNPYLYTQSNMTIIDKRSHKAPKVALGIYERFLKPLLDQVISFVGLIFLSPVYAVIALSIYFDDPGPVFFTQKRVGKDKRFFVCHKFRSMKTSTPKNVPTHMLSDPEAYITRVGAVLRRTSLDELPQIWDIFRGRMSITGPRPALWNQQDLVEARTGNALVNKEAAKAAVDANAIMPGLTGLAQIKGRDKLEIEDKARIDREYAATLRKGGLEAFFQDCKCIFGTVKSVLKHDGVVEGGTGKMHRN